uniref:Uncharacterized protein n=1 Tax=viral metagenome TaxID=1070528 RepID=A0A6M3JEH5_9ZZZZ
MEKTVTFIAKVKVTATSDHAWQRDVRIARTIIKEAIQRQPDLKLLSIENKEE